MTNGGHPKPKPVATSTPKPADSKAVAAGDAKPAKPTQSK